MLFDFWKNSSPRTRRLITIALLFIISIVVTVVGVLSPLSAEDASSINREVDKLRGTVSVQLIFGNNLMICMVMFIPFVGPIFGLFALYNTGVVINAQSMSATAQGVPALLILFTLFFFPFTWLEFLSYSTALAESAWLVERALRHSFRREIKNAAILISIVSVMLLAGAIIEIALISLLGG
jgi:hypothetical protein